MLDVRNMNRFQNLIMGDIYKDGNYLVSLSMIISDIESPKYKSELICLFANHARNHFKSEL